MTANIDLLVRYCFRLSLTVTIFLTLFGISLLPSHRANAQDPSNDPPVRISADAEYSVYLPTIGTTEVWQRYTDRELGISFEYPTTWQLQPLEPEAEGDAYALELYRQWVGTINIQRQENPEHLTPQEWFERQRGSRYDPALVSELAEITVQGNSGIVLGQPDTCRTMPMIVAVIGHDDYLFVFSQYERGTRTSAVEMERLLESLSFGEVNSSSTSLPLESLVFPPAPADFVCVTTAQVTETPAKMCPGAPMFLPTEGNLLVPRGCIDVAYCSPYSSTSGDAYFRQRHPGVDIKTGSGLDVYPVYAPFSGQVIWPKYSAIRIRFDRLGDDPAEYSVYMTHMATGLESEGKDFRDVFDGSRVVAGQVIGHQGDYGVSHTHLHFSFDDAAPGIDSWETSYTPTPLLQAKYLEDSPNWGDKYSGTPLTCADTPTGDAVDVFLLVDLSGSFGDDLPVFKAQAPIMMANLQASNSNTRFGLGAYEDYPISPFGSASCGDQAYRRIVDLTLDTDEVMQGINNLVIRCGNDGPESQLPALFQAATGLGQELSTKGFPGASIAAGQQASFRPEAQKIILLWTDASFHNPGDPGAIPYPGPSLLDTAAAIWQAGSNFAYVPTLASVSLNTDISIPPGRVIGISSGSGGMTQLRMLSRFTGALAPTEGVDCDGDGTKEIPPGEPLVCSIGFSGEGIGEAVAALVEAVVEPTILEVTIDIKPGGEPNSINCRNGDSVIPVAILTTSEFDATTVDHTTVNFAGAHELHIDKQSGQPSRHAEDVDNDGDSDLVLHFRLRDTDLTCVSAIGTLTGETFDSIAIEGTDHVRMVTK